ncbi:MAG: group II intron reverse transcriptase/maturase [Gammaproteobacteria bacterium]|nr:group II intron reverse transcriptase/maturase [Gammaproteobacteria bacterium]
MAASGEAVGTTGIQEDLRSRAKPFGIPKRVVWEAWKRVAANKGAAGVDDVIIEAYQARLSRNLYTLWNRMSSGSYQPQAVRQVLIPKGDGRLRPLGIPSVNDRVAQMVVKLLIEQRLESVFHPSSFGYRPGRSALQAVTQARRNNWRSDWVVEMDIEAFYDTIDHELLQRAVNRHVPEVWIRLYIRRWLECPVRLEDGQIQARTGGTPQGGVISPLLANLFLHYVFDAWMQNKHLSVQFERYADDMVCHCRSEQEARSLLAELHSRFSDCKLRLHPTKTQVVYCKDDRRTSQFPVVRYDFLGFSFHARTCQDRRGRLFAGFNPAVGRKALKRMTHVIRALKINRSTQLTLPMLADRLNPIVRGWIGYFGHLYPEPLKRFLIRLDLRLGCWARNKYKRLRGHKRRSWAWLKRWRECNPRLFAHWEFVYP